MANMRLTAAILALSVAGSTTLAGVEETIPLTEVPADIMAAAEKHLSGLRLSVDDIPEELGDEIEIDDNIEQSYESLGDVTLTGANTETETDGSYVYEIQGTLTDGRKVEIDIEPNGRVEEIEVEFMLEDVPGAVMVALHAKMPDFEPDFIEASHSDSLQVMGYEFVGKSGETEMDLEVSADGRTIMIADQ